MNSKEDPYFSRVALIGMGLIGSSLARILRQTGCAGQISACARSASTRKRVLDLGLVDQVWEDPIQAVKDADLVIFCTPLSSYAALAATIGSTLSSGAILTDVGSCKACVIQDVAVHIPDSVHFIPGHPIAGTEESGPDAGFASLFEGRWCILTPPDDKTDPVALARLVALWKRFGSHVKIMEAAHHDLVLAITSHLPHLIAYSIVDTAATLEEDMRSEIIQFSASGFRDFTRIAASDPVMWRDVFLANRDSVLEILGRFTEDLTALQRAIRRGDGATLEATFTRTRAIRQAIIEAHQA